MSFANKKILIIKLGYSETLDAEISETVSLGDVFRTTAILHCFKDSHVTWLTDEKAVPLLAGNPYIDRILKYNLTSVLQLEAERFDILINLEKVPGLCALAHKVSAWRHMGFRFDVMTGMAEAFDKAYDALSIASSLEIKKKKNTSWLELLYQMLDVPYGGENYILGYTPKTREEHDVGFNINVGRKFPDKGWPEAHWQELEEILASDFSVSHQQSLGDIYGYIDWINSCRCLVTNDSLGLHLAIALNKKVVGLFGPTSPTEIDRRENVVLLHDWRNCPDGPCLLARCEGRNATCMSDIGPERVKAAVARLLGRGLAASEAPAYPEQWEGESPRAALVL